MIPAALRQRPQVICERWMCRPWRTFPIHYGQHSRESRFIAEGYCVSEYLY